MKITLIFSCSGMFRDVPAYSGMFHVPGFIDAPLFSAYYLGKGNETAQSFVYKLSTTLAL